MKVMLVDSPSDPVRFAFLHIWSKRDGMKQADGTTGKASYQATAILKPGGANEAKVKKAISDVCTEKYGKGWADDYAEFADDQKGLRKGNLKKTEGGDIYDGFADMVYVASKNETRPGVFTRAAVPCAEGDEGAPYSGCHGNMEIDIWALKRQGAKKRVCSDLLGLQFTRDGDAFGSGAAPSRADSFASLSVADDEDKPKADPFG